VEKYCELWQATDDNISQERGTLDT